MARPPEDFPYPSPSRKRKAAQSRLWSAVPVPQRAQFSQAQCRHGLRTSSPALLPEFSFIYRQGMARTKASLSVDLCFGPATLVVFWESTSSECARKGKRVRDSKKKKETEVEIEKKSCDTPSNENLTRFLHASEVYGVFFR